MFIVNEKQIFCNKLENIDRTQTFNFHTQILQTPKPLFSMAQLEKHAKVRVERKLWTKKEKVRQNNDIKEMVCVNLFGNSYPSHNMC